MIEKIILASSSPRRREVLDMLKIPFTVISPDCDEDAQAHTVAGYVCATAEKKNDFVADELRKSGGDISKTLIISCDTVVAYNGMVIGKPEDSSHAILTLGVLSDSWHSVYSGLTLRVGEKKVTDFCKTDVKFREISESAIKKYVETGEPMGKAGSYAIQLVGASFAERIEGDYYNIVGFPVSLFTSLLHTHFDTDIFDIANI